MASLSGRSLVLFPRVNGQCSLVVPVVHATEYHKLRVGHGDEGHGVYGSANKGFGVEEEGIALPPRAQLGARASRSPVSSASPCSSTRLS